MPKTAVAKSTDTIYAELMEMRETNQASCKTSGQRFWETLCRTFFKRAMVRITFDEFIDEQEDWARKADFTHSEIKLTNGEKVIQFIDRLIGGR